MNAGLLERKFDDNFSELFQPQLHLREMPTGLFPLSLNESAATILKNRYFVWRHGQSEANAAGIIVSKPENGKEGFGLTEEGLRQIRREATLVHLLSRVLTPATLIYSSPFLRCLQSASEIARIIGTTNIIEEDRLRERDFGEFEGKDKEYYQLIYRLDKDYPGNNLYGVESTDEVATRVNSFIEDLERQFSQENIILVTHADVGEILQATLIGLPSWRHRELPKLINAQVRDFQYRRIRREALC